MPTALAIPRHWTLTSATLLRSWARRAGVLSYINRLRRWSEDRIERAVLAEIRPTDCVWDVGANVGDYTKLLADRVARVIAFEPAPASFAQVQALEAVHANVSALPIGLGAVEERGVMHVASDQASAPWNTLLTPDASMDGMSDPQHVEVTVTTGDRLVAEGVAQPNVVKIDVEGYELDVIKGMALTLYDLRCRAVFVELHFSVLDSRGQRYAPTSIIGTLENYGYRVRWLDLSHIAAIRY